LQNDEGHAFHFSGCVFNAKVMRKSQVLICLLLMLALAAAPLHAVITGIAGEMEYWS
jgi:hypothetical protein